MRHAAVLASLAFLARRKCSGSAWYKLRSTMTCNSLSAAPGKLGNWSPVPPTDTPPFFTHNVGRFSAERRWRLMQLRKFSQSFTT